MEPVSALGVLALVAGLQIKHMICDGPAQTPWMIMGKSDYGNPSGLIHAGIHVIGTLVVLWFLGLPPAMAFALAVADGLIHYHIDFSKEQIVRRLRLTTKDRMFWWSLALDQGLHHLTYIAIIAIIVIKYGQA